MRGICGFGGGGGGGGLEEGGAEGLRRRWWPRRDGAVKGVGRGGGRC